MLSISAPVRVARPSAGWGRSARGAWRWFASGTVLLAIVLHAPSAPGSQASPDAACVLLLDAPPVLERALRAALSPWGMQVEVHSNPSDAAGLSAHPDRASTLARSRSAVALVWLEAAGERRSLWLFDASRSTSTSRDVPPGTLDQALAAALALSIKTLLRGPEGEPITASSAQANAASTAVAAPSVSPAAAAATPPIETRDSGPAESAAQHAPSWQLVLLASLRRGALEPNQTETRFGAELRWAPELPWSWDFAALWFGVRADLGLPRDIAGPSFQGEYSELGGSVSLGLTRRLSQLFSAGLQVSVSLHSASLEGTLLPDTPLAPETRWGSSLQVRPEMGLSLGALGFVVQPALGTALARQSFILGEGAQEEAVGAPASNAPVLETRPVWWMIGVGASVSVE